ncbi:MAG: arylsulfatase [Planctomycetota bacterium]
MTHASDRMCGLAGGLIAALTLVSVVTGEATPYETGRPNIVIVMADDMGYSDIGCYGSEIRTPHLDELAEDGVRFRQFYNTGRCCPSRASLMTGLYPHLAGMGWQAAGVPDPRPGYRGQLADDVPTIAEVLRDAGYATYMSGKWHLTRQSTVDDGPNESWPVERGFDRHFGTIPGGGSFYQPAGLVDGTERLDHDEATWRDGEFYYTREITRFAVERIREHATTEGDRPFFLYIAHTAPHWPMHAPDADIEPYRGLYDVGPQVIRAQRFARQIKLGVVDDRAALPPPDPRAKTLEEVNTRNATKMRKTMEVYAAMVTVLDEGVGSVVDALEETGTLKNTLIIFLSDNGGCHEGGWTGGMWTGNHGIAYGRDLAKIGSQATFPTYGGSWANASNTPFREFKHWVHEGGISTPLIVCFPDAIPETMRGGWIDTPGHIVDLAATALDAADTKLPANFRGSQTSPLSGESLMPVLRGEPVASRDLFWEHEGNRAIRRGDWKLVAKGIDGDWELYDLSVDRTETNDLARVRADLVGELAARWTQWAEDNDVLPLGTPKRQ